MMKAAFLGCGGRARGHANAYKYVKKGQMVALCDMNEERLQSFGDDFGDKVGCMTGGNDRRLDRVGEIA